MTANHVAIEFFADGASMTMETIDAYLAEKEEKSTSSLVLFR